MSTLPRLGKVISSNVISNAETCKPVGNTDVADTGKDNSLTPLMVNPIYGVGEIRKRNPVKLVSSILEYSFKDVVAQASTRQIVRSLILPFVCRHSLRKEWFTPKELDRLKNSFRKVAIRVNQHVTADSREQAYIKYWLDLALFECVSSSSNPPVREEWNTCPLFSGWLKTHLKKSILHKDLSFIYSLQKGCKQAWPALSDLKKVKALDSHKARLSEMKPHCPLDLSFKIMETSAMLFSAPALKFGNFRPLCEDWTKYQKFMPSGSACRQVSLRHGGALGLFGKFQFPSVKTPLGSLGMLNAKIDCWRKENYLKAVDSVKSRLLDVEEGLNHCTILNSVDVVAIPEPGKFRIISKGDGFLYTALQPLQGFMLSCWKHCFASTMLHDDLTSSIQKIHSEARDLPLWCSVDYEAATDLLRKDASLKAFSGLRDSPYFYLGYSSLLRGIAHYPDGSSVRIVEGQLMGHPLSFPLLCLINLAVYWTAIDRWVEDVSLKERRDTIRLAEIMRQNVLVNGDDMLFKCTKTFHDKYFLPCCEDAGFKISVGKHYLSPYFCMMNSQTFIERSVKGVRSMVKRTYLSQKVITGVSLKGGESDSTPLLAARDLNRMVLNLPWSACCVPQCLSRFKNRCFGKYFRPCWYLPSHLGGFGLDPSFAPEDWVKNLSRTQRRMASQFVSSPELQLFSREGFSVPLAKFAGTVLNPRLVIGEYVPRDFEELFDEDPWVARIAYAFRATGQVQTGNSCSNYAPKFIKTKFGHQLHPMSLRGICDYWNARCFTTKKSPCPPLAPIFPYKGRSDRVLYRHTYPVMHKGSYGLIHYEYKTVDVHATTPPIGVDEFYAVAGL